MGWVTIINQRIVILIKTRQVIKVITLVLEPVDPGSILDGEFLEGHEFTSPSWKKKGLRFEPE